MQSQSSGGDSNSDPVAAAERLLAQLDLAKPQAATDSNTINATPESLWNFANIVEQPTSAAVPDPQAYHTDAPPTQEPIAGASLGIPDFNRAPDMSTGVTRDAGLSSEVPTASDSSPVPGTEVSATDRGAYPKAPRTPTATTGGPDIAMSTPQPTCEEGLSTSHASMEAYSESATPQVCTPHRVRHSTKIATGPEVDPTEMQSS